jgi:DNA-binding beta-propeller fold protein YncE
MDDNDLAGASAINEPGVATAAGTAGAAAATEDRRRRRRFAVLLVLAGILAMFTSLVIWYLVFHKPIETILPPITAYNPPHYAFSIYGTKQPIGVAVAPDGSRVYVADTLGTRVVKVYDGSGTELGQLKPPDWTGANHVPVYVAVNPTDGQIYVSDRATATIYIYGQDGAFKQAFAAQVSDGFAPLGLAFDPDGHLYVTDVGGPYHRVLVFDQSGAVVRSIGAAGQLNYPNGVATDGKGDVFVADSSSGRLLVFNADGQQVAAIGQGVSPGSLGTPRGIWIDDQHRLYVADTPGQNIDIYRIPDDLSAGLTFLGSVGVEGTSDGAFEYPFAVTVDTHARIYVSDWANNRVQVWSY